MPARVMALVASTMAAVAVTLLPIAPASADVVNGCDVHVDDTSDACLVFDSDGDGWLYPEVEISWPAVQSVQAGSTMTVAATGVDLVRPLTVTFHRLQRYGDPEPANTIGSVTVGPGALTASTTVPTGDPGTATFAAFADEYDAVGVYVAEEIDLTVLALPSSLSSDLPPARIVKLGARTQAVTGSVSGGARPVHLQVRARDGSWVSVASTTSSASGSYSIGVPTSWVGKHVYRAHAPARGSLAAVDGSSTSSVTVKRSYEPKGSRAHRFMHPRGTRWNACEPITYAVNAARAPAWFAAELRYTLREASAATGLRFADRGRTVFVPFVKSFADNPDGVDLVLAWTTPAKVDSLVGPTAGLGGAQSSGNVVFNGGVVLDATTRASRAVWREIIMHEVGHALGLAHVADRRQVMVSGATGKNTRYGKGDLTGLAALGAGAGACTGEPPTYQRGASGQRPAASSGKVREVVLP